MEMYSGHLTRHFASTVREGKQRSRALQMLSLNKSTISCLPLKLIQVAIAIWLMMALHWNDDSSSGSSLKSTTPSNNLACPSGSAVFAALFAAVETIALC